MEEYVDALIGEMRSAFSRTDLSVDTIYIGGGTPTALPSFLICKILDNLHSRSEDGCISRAPSVTVEANPGTLTREYLAELKNHGVTRLSIGLQTTKPHLLKAINRVHTMGDFWENFHVARDAGFDNINVDLMFGLPGQTLQDWRETLEEVIALSPEHISAYSLTPAENTPLWHKLEEGTLQLPDDATDRNMYHAAREQLAKAGYVHYELSNFAKPGFESRHNINCWRRVPYTGFGLGAHSFDGEKRWSNTEDLDEYLGVNRNPPHKRIIAEHLSEKDHLAETMILGLRLMQGVPEAAVPAIYNEEVTTLVGKGLLTRQDGYVRLTPLGMDLANQVFAAFV